MSNHKRFLFYIFAESNTMTGEIKVPDIAGKTEKYESLIPQIKSLLEGEKDSIANIANVIAALKFGMNFFWVGIYRVHEVGEKKELVLGPFQGPVACTRISYGKGVCGKAWERGETIIVDDVEQFPGHIACNSLSKSEIVIPVFNKSRVIAVLDVDSTQLSDFNSTDALYLEKVCHILSEVI